ncbi:MAG: hemolysin family protein [Dehalococcoidales bacterium]|nr:hemolysin family protein [Dehalococcoidales bacterium]MDP7525678.1 hemolysin family protein [Dehalococcoidales bacterium]
MSSTEALYLVLLVVCLILSAFFSGSETAFISLQKVRLEHLVSTEARGAKRVARLLERPEKLLSIVLLGNTFVNTAAAALATALAMLRWGPQYGVIIATAGITVVLLIFAETTPKTIAAHYAERISFLAVRPLEFVSWLFTPFVFGLSWIAARTSRALGGEMAPRSLASSEEIRNMITVGHKEGTVEDTEARLLHKVFDFGDRPVREVMVPRLEVMAIEKGSAVADFLALYTTAPLSRFPVFQENMDNVVGILSIRDVLMGLARGAIDRQALIDELVRPAYFTPETKLIDELFAEMRDDNYQMCVVIDEFGGTAGIVSLSGIIEEIVGPVGDELVEPEKEFEAIDENTFQIDGGMRIEEVNEEMALGLPDSEEYETMAGFILSLLGHIPEQGEQVRYEDANMVITRMRGLKIEEILLTKEKPSESGEGVLKLDENKVSE